MSQEEIDSLAGNYHSAFRAYKDAEIQDAADDYMNGGEYFPPKPAQIINLVKNIDQSRHNRELVERYTCIVCKQKVSAISEGACLDCLGIPDPVYTRPPLPEAMQVNYLMEGRILCQMCNRVGMCIKEPAHSGMWLCRQCYTGLTSKEIAERFGKLVNGSLKAELEDGVPF